MKCHECLSRLVQQSRDHRAFSSHSQARLNRRIAKLQRQRRHNKKSRFSPYLLGSIRWGGLVVVAKRIVSRSKLRFARVGWTHTDFMMKQQSWLMAKQGRPETTAMEAPDVHS